MFEYRKSLFSFLHPILFDVPNNSFGFRRDRRPISMNVLLTTEQTNIKRCGIYRERERE